MFTRNLLCSDLFYYFISTPYSGGEVAQLVRLTTAEMAFDSNSNSLTIIQVLRRMVTKQELYFLSNSIYCRCQLPSIAHLLKSQ